MEILTSVKRLYISFKSLVNDFVYSFGRTALLLLVEVQNHTVPVRERGRIRVKRKRCSFVLHTFVQIICLSYRHLDSYVRDEWANGCRSYRRTVHWSQGLNKTALCLQIVQQYTASLIEYPITPSPRLTSHLFYAFLINAPCQYTFFNLRHFVFGSTPFRWLRCTL